MRPNKITIVLLALTALALAGCTKKRADYFPQGSGQDLISMSINRKYTLTTGEKTGKKADLTAALSAKIEKNNHGMNNLEIVKYTTTSEILDKYGDIEFVGKPDGEVYDLDYEFTDAKLMIYITGKGDATPYYKKRYVNKGELLTPEAESKKLYRVPLFGCNVSYINVQNQLNQNQQKTKRLTELKVDTPKEATHFRLDEASCKEFSFSSRRDVFESKLFEGTWYYSETIIKMEDKWSPLVGWEIGGDFNGNSAHKVKFIKYKDAIHAVNENVDERIATQDINKASVVSIPVTDWYEFEVDDNDSLKEVENKEHSWSARPYVGLDFRYIYTMNFPFTFDGSSINEFLVGINDESDGVRDGKGSDYFSITLQKSTFNTGQQSTSRTKVAFMRADTERKYKPRTYHKDDSQIFGFFTAERDFIKNQENDRRGDVSKYRNISRFNPEREVLEFRFSDDSTHDPRIRGLAQKAVKAWQDTFAQAGLKTKFDLKLDPSNDVGLGDLRSQMAREPDNLYPRIAQ